MSWLYSQALVEACSPQECSDGESSVQLSVMPTPHKFWHNDKMMDHSNLSRFGLTLQLLTESRGEELLRLYLEVFLARTFQGRVKEWESQEREADCGQKWSELLGKYDPNTFSWRTSQCSLLEDLEQSLEIWPKWGSMLNGACYLRPRLALPTSEKESGFSPTPDGENFHHTPNTTGMDGGSNSRKALKKRQESWPTPNTMDSLPSRSYEAMKRQATNGARKNRRAPGNLRERLDPLMCDAYDHARLENNPQILNQKAMWPTPTSSQARSEGLIGRMRELVDDGKVTLEEAEQMISGSLTPARMKKWPTPIEDDANNATRDSGSFNSLTREVRNWPTPRTRGLLGGSGSREMVKAMVESGEITEDQASNMMGVAMFPTPRASEYKDTGPVGSKSHAHMLERDYLCAAVKEEDMPKGVLNPTWVEWLMGWPVHWTVLGDVEIGWNENWEDEPIDVPRVSTGVKERVSRLRAIGNGQVPLCAATAFILLMERIK